MSRVLVNFCGNYMSTTSANMEDSKPANLNPDGAESEARFADLCKVLFLHLLFFTPSFYLQSAVVKN